MAICGQSVGEVINMDSGFEFTIGENLGQIAEPMGAEVNVGVGSQCLRPEKCEVGRL